MFTDIQKLRPMNNPMQQTAIHSYSRNLAMLLAATMIISSLGCCNVKGPLQGFGNLFIEGPVKCYRDTVWAKRAYNMRYNNCGRQYSDHFENGFCAGYGAVCTGGDGFVPAMPPEEYWGNDYQSGDGAQCVNSWFEGYPAGAAAAKRDRAGNFNDVFMSKMMQAAVVQEKAPHKLPSDVPVVKPERRTQVAPPRPYYSQGMKSEPMGSREMSLPPEIMQVDWETVENK